MKHSEAKCNPVGWRGFVGVALLVLAALPTLAQAAFPPLTIVTVRSPIPRGGQGLVTAQTTPYTYCVIRVIYRSGESHARGLEPKFADSRGRVSWTWKVGTRTTPGAWPIIIECGRGDITRVRTSFEVI